MQDLEKFFNKMERRAKRPYLYVMPQGMLLWFLHHAPLSMMHDSLKRQIKSWDNPPTLRQMQETVHSCYAIKGLASPLVIAAVHELFDRACSK